MVRFTGLAPADEYARHRTYLSRRFGAEGVSEPRTVDFLGHPGLGYTFRGAESERSVVLVPVGDDLIRFIIDSRSRLNQDILDSVTFHPNGGSKRDGDCG